MRYFFILALGRSGTNFLATLLSQDTRGRVHHEPYRLDARFLNLRHAGVFGTTLDHLLEQRFSELLPQGEDLAFYGEVNSFLRYEVDWLRRRFDPVLIHLVRDGRDFVRSAYIRKVYTSFELDGPILPRDDDPYAARWAGMSRFQRLCWYWMHTNEFLASRCESFARFEDMLRDYDLFDSRVLQLTGVKIPRELWEREIGRPKNTSRDFRMKKMVREWVLGKRQGPSIEPLPSWKEWDAETTDQFWQICGDTMNRFGYRQ